MKVTKEKSAENRLALIKAAASLFRQRGIDGVGVADISKAAELTHGALYAQFESKQELAAAALDYALQGANAAMEQLASAPRGAAHVVDYYLSQDHVTNIEGGCAMAASASEIARQDEAVRDHFARRFVELADTVANNSRSGDEKPRREDAFAVVSAMIGAVAVARGVRDVDPELANQVLDAMKRLLEPRSK